MSLVEWEWGHTSGQLIDCCKQQIEHKDEKQSYYTWSKDNGMQSDLDLHLLYIANVKPLGTAYN